MAKVAVAKLAIYAVDQLDKGVAVEVLSKQIAGYLLEMRSSRELSHVMRAIETELNRRGRTQVAVTSAHAIDEATKKALATLLEANNPVFHETIDESIVGGVKARSGESEIDLTVRGRLNRFKANIINSN